MPAAVGHLFIVICLSPLSSLSSSLCECESEARLEMQFLLLLISFAPLGHSQGQSGPGTNGLKNREREEERWEI